MFPVQLVVSACFLCCVVSSFIAVDAGCQPGYYSNDPLQVNCTGQILIAHFRRFANAHVFRFAACPPNSWSGAHSSTCISCGSGEYFIDSTTPCAQCDSIYCDQCASLTTCQQCQRGFYVDNNGHCVGTNTRCGVTLKVVLCRSVCVPGCYACVTATRCYDCGSHGYVDSNGQCHEYPTNNCGDFGCATFGVGPSPADLAGIIAGGVILFVVIAVLIGYCCWRYKSRSTASGASAILVDTCELSSSVSGSQPDASPNPQTTIAIRGEFLSVYLDADSNSFGFQISNAQLWASLRHLSCQLLRHLA